MIHKDGTFTVDPLTRAAWKRERKNAWRNLLARRGAFSNSGRALKPLTISFMIPKGATMTLTTTTR